MCAILPKKKKFNNLTVGHYNLRMPLCVYTEIPGFLAWKFAGIYPRAFCQDNRFAITQQSLGIRARWTVTVNQTEPALKGRSCLNDSLLGDRGMVKLFPEES